jgi:uncharacterized protein (TIGR02145 family)/prepilin-type N-terminal cleavage/methylation domain-containing protein
MTKNKQTGFTLIELLVVIAIIGALSTLALVSLNSARIKGRNAKRVADIKQISTALELYYSDHNSYPALITPGEAMKSADDSITYLGVIPSNPSPRADGNCLNKEYQYSTSYSNSKYKLGYCISNNVSELSDKAHIASGDGMSICQPITYQGQTYNAVAIGSQCLMSNSLNVGTQLCAGEGGTYCNTNPSDINVIEKYCYDNDAEICTTDGALYTWYETVGLAQGDNDTVLAEPVQGICPVGWHVPTDEEFNTLENYLWDSGDCSNSRDNPTQFDCDEASDKLKTNSACSAIIFTDNCNLTNFSMILGGFAWNPNPNGTFSNRGTYGYLWESYSDTNNGYGRNYKDSDSGIARRSIDKTARFQVRCVKD